MGLLDGLQSLQGAPPPNAHGSANGNALASSNSSSSSSSAHHHHHHSTNGGGGGGVAGLNGAFGGLGVSGPNMDALGMQVGQFAAGARGFFTDVGSKLGDTLAPAVDNLSEGAKSSVTSLRRMMGDETVDDDIESGTSGSNLSGQQQQQQQQSSQPQTQQMSLSDEMSSMFNLTMFQRIALFAMCFGTGILLIALSFTFLPLIVIAPQKFAAAFTMGNLLAIISTWMLVGPRAQLQSMFSPGRTVAASVYIISLLVTLLAAFFGGKFRYIFVLIALVSQISSCKFFFSFFCIENESPDWWRWW